MQVGVTANSHELRRPCRVKDLGAELGPQPNDQRVVALVALQLQFRMLGQISFLQSVDIKLQTVLGDAFMKCRQRHHPQICEAPHSDKRGIRLELLYKKVANDRGRLGGGHVRSIGKSEYLKIVCVVHFERQVEPEKTKLGDDKVEEAVFFSHILCDHAVHLESETSDVMKLKSFEATRDRRQVQLGIVALQDPFETAARDAERLRERPLNLCAHELGLDNATLQGAARFRFTTCLGT
mmetsp:Transcript_15859/g.37508  ORF Transcript_15859/g.37508 Transcript_15859/m.37508 type:complete len:238 (-) Transcript_15859:152-865(-)